MTPTPGDDGFEESTFEGADTNLQVDLSGVEEAKFELVPNGKYQTTVEKCDYKLSNSSGQPMWAMQLTIIGGDFNGRKLFYNMSFSPKALPFTKKNLAALAPELLSGPFDLKTAAPSMVGRSVVARVAKGQNQDGEDRSEVKGLLASGGGDAFMTA